MPYDGGDNLRIVVYGDYMVDRTVTVSASKFDQATAVPAYEEQDVVETPGGAGLAAANVLALGGTPVLCGLVNLGAAALYDGLALQGAEVCLTVRGDTPTPVRTRYRTDKGALLWRLNSVIRGVLPPNKEEYRSLALKAAVRETARAGGLLMSDYGKGALRSGNRNMAAAAARDCGIPVVYDPDPAGGWGTVPATVVTPNLAEYYRACPPDVFLSLPPLEELKQKSSIWDFPVNILLDPGVRTALRADSILLTAGSAGLLYGGLVDGTAETGVRNAPIVPGADATGCGDAVSAAAAVALACNMSVGDMLDLALAAGSAAAATPGVAPLCSLEVFRWYTKLTSRKIVSTSFPLLSAILRRPRKHKVVVTNGVFDLLHSGHRNMLQWAAAQGDFLIVLVNSDASAMAAKGRAPVQHMEERAAAVAALPAVDAVMVFHEATPEAVLQQLQPDILVKGGDTPRPFVGEDIVTEAGGKALAAPEWPGLSTSSLRERAAAVI